MRAQPDDRDGNENPTPAGPRPAQSVLAQPILL